MFIWLTSCTVVSFSPDTEPRLIIPPEDYPIYDCALTYFYAADTSALKIQQQTQMHRTVEQLTYAIGTIREYHPDVAESTLLFFRDVNAHCSLLEPLFECQLEYTLIGEKSSRRRNWWWKNERSTPDSNAVILSRIGKSPDSTEALVYVGRRGGPYNGLMGYIVVLRRQYGSEWQVYDAMFVWNEKQ